jgi:hypothetical protein
VGNFYVNFSVRTPDQQRVADVLRAAGRVAVVTPPHGGYVVACDEEADTQATEPVLRVGELLSREARAPVLAVLNHDDDILCYWLFEGGQLTDSYNSRPDYFGDGDGDGEPEQGGDAGRLCTALGSAAAPAAVDALLRGEHVFAVDQHQQLAGLLGLPPWSAGLGYRYATEEDLEGEIGAGPFIRTG